jgi:hypothetical protein
MRRVYTSTHGTQDKYKVMVGNPEANWPFLRLNRSEEDNIKGEFIRIWWVDVDCINLAQDCDHGNNIRATQNNGISAPS